MRRKLFLVFALTSLAAPLPAAAQALWSEPSLFEAAFADTRFAADDEFVRTTQSFTAFGSDAGAGVRLSALSVARPQQMLAPAGSIEPDLQFGVTVQREWLQTVRLARYSLEIAPHAGVGLAPGGAQLAEAGASFLLGKGLPSQLGDALGVSNGEAVYGDRGRWYLFGSAKGRAVGMNLFRTGWGLRGDGLTMDKGGFVGLAQAGVGWRKGGLQASLGYTHTRVRVRDWGRQRSGDDRFGLTLSLRP